MGVKPNVSIIIIDSKILLGQCDRCKNDFYVTTGLIHVLFSLFHTDLFQQFSGVFFLTCYFEVSYALELVVVL